MPLFLLFAACETHTTDTTTSVEGGPAIEATAIPTVYKISWDSTAPSVGRVNSGLNEDWDHWAAAVDSEGGLHHEATVAFPAGSTSSWRVVDDDTPGEGGEVQVVGPPPDLPVWSVSMTGGNPNGGYSVGTALEAGDGTAVWVLDSYGRYVWWKLIPDHTQSATNAQVSADGLWIEWVKGGGDEFLYRVRIDGSAEEDISIPGLHHEAIPMPGGGWAAIVKQPRSQDGEQVVGEAIDEVAEDGTLTEVFSTWDTIDVVASEGEETEEGWDAVHLNGIFYDEDADRFYLSSWARSSVLAVNRSDGSLAWELGGPHSQMELLSGEPFKYQHAPRLDNDGNVMVFDNGDSSRLISRVASFEVDESAMTYAQDWEWEPDPAIYSAALGNADRQDDGTLYVGWGIAGRLEHLDADGAVVWRLEADLGGATGYVHHLDTFSGSPG